jgi:glucose/arabinose dehydrogenase
MNLNISRPALASLVALMLLLAACQPLDTETPTPHVPLETITPGGTPTPHVEQPTQETPQPSPEAALTPAEFTPTLEPATATPTPTDIPPTATDIYASGPLNTILRLELVAEGFSAPLGIVSARDGSGRLYIFDQVGTISILNSDGELMSEHFLDVRDRMTGLSAGYDERGLLGLAFHPEYAENGRFYVYYSAPSRPDGPPGWNHTSHISEFQVLEDNPDRADPQSERIILQIDQPQSNHNAGQILFGPDGYLYIPLGDGGGAHDTGPGHPGLGHGQDITTLLGSILRIDVDGGDPYSVPPDNPLIEGEGLDEIFAYGFRNPYRVTFDSGGNNELFAADAGQNLWEEVSIVQPGGNYGWNIKEGTHCFDPSNPTQPPAQCSDSGPRGEPLIDPVIEYANFNAPGGGIGLVVIGGYVYRGETIPDLQGRYIFGDWSTSFRTGNGILLAAYPPDVGEGLWEIDEIRLDTPDGRLGAFLLSFGQDDQNELYVLVSDNAGPAETTGRVYKLSPSGER